MLPDASLSAGTGLPAQRRRCSDDLSRGDVLARTSLEPEEADELTTAQTPDLLLVVTPRPETEGHVADHTHPVDADRVARGGRATA